MTLVTITVGGRQVAQGRVERTTPIGFSLDEGMDDGEYTGTPVILDYDVPKPSVPGAVAGSKTFTYSPFKFNGEIERVVVETK